MQLNSDFVDLLLQFNAAGVEYIIIGAYAMSAHGMPRYTGDIDLLYNPTADNAELVLKALQQFGYTSEQLTIDALLEPDVVFYFGHPPYRIDLLNGISGLSFEQAWETRDQIKIDGLTVSILSLESLAANKRATGRIKDLADLELIQKRISQSQ